jgi:DNA repair exonuclease SbcCD ATPase subunit
MLTQLTEGIRRLQKLNKDMSELELKEEILNLRQLLMDAREELSARTDEIAQLKERIGVLTSGEACPICGEGRLKVSSSREHPEFGFAGVQERTLKCSNCAHTEKRLHDPNNIIKGGRQ